MSRAGAVPSGVLALVDPLAHTGGGSNACAWFTSTPVLSVVVAVLLAEALLRIVRVTLDAIVAPVVRAHLGRDDATLQRATWFRVGLAIVEFAALAAIAYCVARYVMKRRRRI